MVSPPQPKPTAIAAATLLITLLSISISSRGTPDTTVLQVLCNSQTYSAGDPFAGSLKYVLADLEAATPARAGHDYYSISPWPNSFAYGHASCSKNLTASDCEACLDAAKSNMAGTCGSAIGARAELRDCQMRYEQYAFDD